METNRGKIESKKMLIYIFFIIALIGILFKTIKLESSMLLAGAFIIWLFMVLYTIMDICNHIALLFFLLSFFVFLLGREVCYVYFGLDRYYVYLNTYNKITFFLLSVSLVFVWLGYVYAGSKYRILTFLSKRKEYAHERLVKNNFIYCTSIDYARVCKYFFYICYIASIIAVAMQIIYIYDNGYLAWYTGNGSRRSEPFLLSYLSAFTGTALCLYLATWPAKKSAICSLIFYEIYGVLTLFTGQRYGFVAISMTIIVYICLRNHLESGWVTKKHIIILLVMIPVLIVVLLALDTIRVGGEFKFKGIENSIISFLDQQGGSVNVIKRIFYYKDELDNLILTSFDNLRSVIFENILTRKIFDIKVYSGNSIEHALYGHSLAHRLSYLEYGDMYLQGHGVGSCYIAELCHDFGLIGVMAGNFFYGGILRAINQIQFAHPFKDGILLSMIYYLMLSPRGNFDGFIGGLFSLYSIFFFVIILIITKLLTWRRRKKKYTDGGKYGSANYSIDSDL